MSELALILLVDDDDNDCTLMRRAFIKANVLNPVIVTRSGQEAIDYLSGVRKYTNRAEFPLPALVPLDIKMPGIDGFEVLGWIRSQPGLKNIRVVILTSSDDIKDINMAYQLGANSFLTKPTDFEKFLEIAGALGGYWVWLDKAPDSFRTPLAEPGLPRVGKSQPPAGAE